MLSCQAAPSKLSPPRDFRPPPRRPNRATSLSLKPIVVGYASYSHACAPGAQAVGDKVECRMGENIWTAGTVRKIWYQQADWSPDCWAPYQVELDSKAVVFVPADLDHLCRRCGKCTSNLPLLVIPGFSLSRLHCDFCRR